MKIILSVVIGLAMVAMYFGWPVYWPNGTACPTFATMEMANYHFSSVEPQSVETEEGLVLW